MKIDRLIGILSVLLQKEVVTAPYLAKRFEVSRRTISRDIENLCKAGIPVVTRQGAGGGISIIGDYKIDRTLLTKTEMQDIITGLKSLDSVSGTNYYKCLMEKFSAGSLEKVDNQCITVDLSGWDKSAISEKIELLKVAIKNRQKISFKYFLPKGESKRALEPYQIIFQWSNWYLWGFCESRQDYRMFKLARMADLKCTDKTFEKRGQSEFVRLDNWNVCDNIKAIVKFDRSAKWKVIDDFGMEHLEYDQNQNILLNYTWVDKNALFHYVLSLGDKAEIIQPIEYRREFAELLESIMQKYKN